MKLTITNAKVVTPLETRADSSVHIKNGKIEAIGGPSSVDTEETTLDAQGAFLMPGIIDLHTDAMDVEIIPRPGADFPIEIAFHELERKMAGCGITTVFHSMYMGYEEAEKRARSKYSREEVFERVYQCSKRATHINNKIHLRYELPGTYHYDSVVDCLEKGYVDLLSVMDHTPGQGQVQSERFIQIKMRDGWSREKAESELQKEQSRDRIAGQKLTELIDFALERQVPVASHDDDSIEKVEAFFDMGVGISEFPINTEAARRAKELGMETVGGSSNILRGGSLSGNLGVTDAIKAGLIDSICSDYYPPSILHSIFKLEREGILSLSDAVNLASRNPARAVGLDHLTGSLEVGKNADLILVNVENEMPIVTHTIVNGHLTNQCQPQPQKELAWQ
ncbi:MAG: alpha-D-ribose 1-methylphosphonate 5-triphosphate diphosphatase [Bacteroidota bacterium]